MSYQEIIRAGDRVCLYPLTVKAEWLQAQGLDPALDDNYVFVCDGTGFGCNPDGLGRAIYGYYQRLGPVAGKDRIDRGCIDAAATARLQAEGRVIPERQLYSVRVRDLGLTFASLITADTAAEAVSRMREGLLCVTLFVLVGAVMAF
jgi:hypothetical protein